MRRQSSKELRADWKGRLNKMKIANVKLALISVTILIAIGSPLSAHHGTAAFNTEEVTVKGTVTNFVFVNPHCQLYWETKNEKGEIEKWQGELTAPTKLMRAGWTKYTLKAGDPITVSGQTVKSGNRTMWIRKMIGPDGKAMQLFED
jgi:hypothetical protein